MSKSHPYLSPPPHPAFTTPDPQGCSPRPSSVVLLFFCTPSVFADLHLPHGLVHRSTASFLLCLWPNPSFPRPHTFTCTFSYGLTFLIFWSSYVATHRAPTPTPSPSPSHTVSVCIRRTGPLQNPCRHHTLPPSCLCHGFLKIYILRINVFGCTRS